MIPIHSLEHAIDGGQRRCVRVVGFDLHTRKREPRLPRLLVISTPALST